jgi:hypothetical protein
MRHPHRNRHFKHRGRQYGVPSGVALSSRTHNLLDSLIMARLQTTRCTHPAGTAGARAHGSTWLRLVHQVLFYLFISVPVPVPAQAELL